MFVTCVGSYCADSSVNCSYCHWHPRKYGEMQMNTSLQGESSAASVKQDLISADSKRKKKPQKLKDTLYYILNY